VASSAGDARVAASTAAGGGAVSRIFRAASPRRGRCASSCGKLRMLHGARMPAGFPWQHRGQNHRRAAPL